MGNIESSSKVNVGQLQGLSPRELNISRSLAYEEYQQVTIIGSVSLMKRYGKSPRLVG